MNELSLDQLSTISGGNKTNHFGFIGEAEVDKATNKKGGKNQSNSRSKVFIKDVRPSNCVSTLVTDAFPMGEW